MEKYSKSEKKILNYFFTNTTKPVFVLLNMPEVLKGALFSRYSRSTKSLRRLFLDQYLNSDELGLASETDSLEQLAKIKNFLNTGKAKKFYSKWLAMYGDDSIAELGGIHIGIEDISVVATKSIEDRRIGISPLEKSTRYVRYDDKIAGKWRYYKDPNIMESKDGHLYQEAMDFMFETYSGLLDPVMDYFRKKYPQKSDTSDGAYQSSIRAKACDTLRGLLPMGTITNMGIFANGRAIEYMLTKMYAHPLPEVNQLAKLIHRESKLIIENFVERIDSDKGEAYIDYLKTQNSKTKTMSQKILGEEETFESSTQVTLVDYDNKALTKVAASILFPNSVLTLQQILNRVKKLTSKEQEELIKNYVRERRGRWHKIGRAFEEVYYSFEIISDLGVYKDLQRHRMQSQFRQNFTTEHGFETPQDVIESGFKSEYEKAMKIADLAYKKFKNKFPYQAQYLACHGNLGRWRVKMNLREAFHMCELRSSPQGHPNYRKVAQEMYRLIKKIHPVLGGAMKYVNMQDPGLERLASEVRKEEKLDAVKRK